MFKINYLIIWDQNDSATHILKHNALANHFGLSFFLAYKSRRKIKIVLKEFNDAKFIYKDYIFYCTAGGAIGILDVMKELHLTYYLIDAKQC